MRAARQGGPRGWEGKWGRTGHVRCRARWGAPLNPYSVSLRCGNLRSGNLPLLPFAHPCDHVIVHPFIEKAPYVHLDFSQGPN